MEDKTRWGTRLIRPGGRVKLYGHWYRPSSKHMKYDGRLDGMRYLFAVYPFYGRKNEKRMAFMWGLPENSGKGDRVDDPQVVDGFLNWSFWCEEDNGKSAA